MAIKFTFNVRKKIIAEEGGNKTAEDAGLFRRVFPRTILKWKEPEVFRDARKGAEKGSLKNLGIIITLSSIIFIFFINLIYPEITFRLFVVLGLLELFIFFVASVYRVSPYYVWITDTSIVHDINVEDPSYINFKDIRHCEIATVVIDETAYPSLIVEAIKGERELIGIAASIKTNELRALLESKGVMVTEVTKLITPEGAVR